MEATSAHDEHIKQAKESGHPYTVYRGHVDAPGYRLSNVEWHPNGMFGDIGQPETGVRRMVDGVEVRDSFFVIQHGWWDFDAASNLIAKAFAKGWDERRISALMEWMLNRKRVSRVDFL